MKKNVGHQIATYYNDVIMGAMASQIPSLTIVYSSVSSGADQRKYQNSASLAFVRGSSPVTGVNSSHKGPVTRKKFPFDDVMMNHDNTDLMRCAKLYSGYFTTTWMRAK